MIQDIEGATAESSRRRHIAALSTGVAAVSLALFVALIVPPARDEATPHAASPAPSASAPSLTNVSNPLSNAQQIMRPSRWRTGFVAGAGMCLDGTWSTPLHTVVYDRTGERVVAVLSAPRTSRSVPASSTFVADPRTSPFFVTCVTSELFAPRESFAR